MVHTDGLRGGPGQAAPLTLPWESISPATSPAPSHSPLPFLRRDWIKDIEAYNHLAGAFPYPIIADEERHLAVQLGMLDPDERTADGLCLTARAVYIVGPDNRLKLSILYPATTGRNFQ